MLRGATLSHTAIRAWTTTSRVSIGIIKMKGHRFRENFASSQYPHGIILWTNTSYNYKSSPITTARGAVHLTPVHREALAFACFARPKTTDTSKGKNAPRHTKPHKRTPSAIAS